MKAAIFIGTLFVVFLFAITFICNETDDFKTGAMTKEENAAHMKKVRKHGIENAAIVYVGHDGKEWYYNKKGQRCEFK